MTVALPWPPSILRPNARPHWRQQRAAAKAYKSDCLMLCLAARLPKPAQEKITLAIEFCPPDSRRRDLDNMLSSFKHGIDAVADALGVNDYRFGFQIKRGRPVKGGAVKVTIA